MLHIDFFFLDKIVPKVFLNFIYSSETSLQVCWIFLCYRMNSCWRMCWYHVLFPLSLWFLNGKFPLQDPTCSPHKVPMGGKKCKKSHNPHNHDHHFINSHDTFCTWKTNILLQLIASKLQSSFKNRIQDHIQL